MWNSQYLFVFLAIISLWTNTASAVRLDSDIAYRTICQQAAQDETVFANFKRNPFYQQFLEQLSFDQGKDYLRVIHDQFPELLSLRDKFHENDVLGNPRVYNFENVGRFSPTTLRYVKIAGDLKKKFNDLSHMHIVEIGGGYGGLCKIIADACGFASYTIVDLPECCALAKVYLEKLGVDNVHFISSNELERASTYDLVISNYNFSEIDSNKQLQHIQKIIGPTPRGYLTLKFNQESLSLEDLIGYLFQSGHQGKVEGEHPSTPPRHILLTWKTPSDYSSDFKATKPQLVPSSKKQKGNAITYTFSGGRLGDNILAYLHASWIAYKYHLPLLYLPFHFSDQMAMDRSDQRVGDSGFSFAKTITIQREDEIHSHPESTLFSVPYFPDGKVEYDEIQMPFLPYFEVDWQDPIFRKQMLASISLQNPIQKVNIPSKFTTVGVHIRRGGDYESGSFYQNLLPLKFPPDRYFIRQIKRMANLFEDQKLYVYIFTDDLNPEALIEDFKNKISNPNLIFDCRHTINGPNINILEDFFSFAQFDCFIGSQSNYSYTAARLFDFAVTILPKNYHRGENGIVIDDVKINFKPTDRIKTLR